MSFLLFYTLLALPGKDWFIHSIFFKFLYPDTGDNLVKDKRIKELSNISEISHLLKILLRELNINGLIMATNGKSPKQKHYYRDPDKAYTPISQSDLETISLYFQQSVRKSISGVLPEEIKMIADQYDLGGLIPIYYKSKYFGFLAAIQESDTKKLAVLEGLAGRIGLIMENEELTQSAMKNESFKKEFSLARQVEKFLILKEVISINNYQVSADKNLFDGVSFPVLFEKSIIETGSENPYFIFCRISKSNRRMRTMMLFMIAGYFLTLSKNAKNLRDLFGLLNDSLCANGPEFSIDGFLIRQTAASNWQVNYFGKNVQIKCDGKDTAVKYLPSLGNARNVVFEHIDLKNKNEIILCINHIPGIRIVKK